MNSCELSFGITALANAIAKNFDDDQLALLGAVFTQLGDTLATIATQRSLCGNNSGSSNNTATVSPNADAAKASGDSISANTGRPQGSLSDNSRG